MPLTVARPGRGAARGTQLTGAGRALLDLLTSVRGRLNQTVGPGGPTAEEIAARGRASARGRGGPRAGRPVETGVRRRPGRRRPPRLAGGNPGTIHRLGNLTGRRAPDPTPGAPSGAAGDRVVSGVSSAPVKACRLGRRLRRRGGRRRPERGKGPEGPAPRARRLAVGASLFALACRGINWTPGRPSAASPDGPTPRRHARAATRQGEPYQPTPARSLEFGSDLQRSSSARQGPVKSEGRAGTRVRCQAAECRPAETAAVEGMPPHQVGELLVPRDRPLR